MLSVKATHKGLVFSVNVNGQDIHFKEWSNTDDCIYYFPLSTLVDNGFAIYYKNECTVPYENIYMIDEEDRTLLGIPDKYNKSIRLRSEGTLNNSDFKYKIEFLTYVPDGEILLYERNENILSIGNKEYFLSDAQYKLVSMVDSFNAEDETLKTSDYNFRRFAEIKALAILSDCELDSYLQNENVFAPDKIKLEIGCDDEGFTIDPSIEMEGNEKFQKTFDRMRKIQGVYPVAKESGERIRVVLKPEQKKDLEFLKKTGGRHKTREEMDEIIQHSTEYFDPDQFDLSEFYSDRVIEIGVYKPKFYPFICPYKSCWIAGATIETPGNGTTRITIDDGEELASLKSAIEDAVDKNSHVISFKDTELDLEDAKFLAEMAEKQLRQPQKPIDEDLEKQGRKVLIIEDNAEELGFVANDSIIEKEDKYTLFQNPYLKDGLSLKTHQEEGVAWLQHLYNSKASGCLMADDMGLGKTLQILYFIDWHSRKYVHHKPYLIVAPISLLENWENEYDRFFKSPHMNISRLTSRDVPRHFKKSVVDWMQGLDIILTNYESLRNAQLNFCAVEFDVVALDEAQKIKSPGTLVTNAAKALKANFKIAMTGTPVENTLLDLWCIMDFCVPGLLGNAKAFAAKYQNPLRNEDVDVVALGNEVHKQLGIYFMRRLKKDAAKDLPSKIELKQRVYMPTVQEDAYVEALNRYVSGLQPNMLSTITKIKYISEHPYLFEPELLYQNSKEVIIASARLQSTIMFLDEIQTKNEKVIIFAERKETQKMLQRICRERYGIVSKIINGDTPTSGSKQSRQIAIDEFQSEAGFNIIIMSPIAAGMGLNVTAANHVIHYSRHWNPAKENQATDRAYRIGQTKDVYVYYPMAISEDFRSFDESLDELLSNKTSLATSTIFPTERVEVKPDELGQMLFG